MPRLAYLTDRFVAVPKERKPLLSHLAAYFSKEETSPAEINGPMIAIMQISVYSCPEFYGEFVLALRNTLAVSPSSSFNNFATCYAISYDTSHVAINSLLCIEL